MSAAKPPAHVALPRQSQYLSVSTPLEPHTLKDKVDGEEVGANWQRDHGKGEAHQFPND
jgi:hypothetical protein